LGRDDTPSVQKTFLNFPVFLVNRIKLSQAVWLCNICSVFTRRHFETMWDGVNFKLYGIAITELAIHCHRWLRQIVVHSNEILSIRQKLNRGFIFNDDFYDYLFIRSFMFLRLSYMHRSDPSTGLGLQLLKWCDIIQSVFTDVKFDMENKDEVARAILFYEPYISSCNSEESG